MTSNSIGPRFGNFDVFGGLVLGSLLCVRYNGPGILTDEKSDFRLCEGMLISYLIIWECVQLHTRTTRTAIAMNLGARPEIQTSSRRSMALFSL